MPTSPIYVLEGDRPDLSRWLSISPRPQGRCMLQLADLCHPGQVTALGNVACDVDALKEAVAGSAVQVTTAKGYLLIRREGERAVIEFKAREDAAVTKVEVDAAEVAHRLENLA